MNIIKQVHEIFLYRELLKQLVLKDIKHKYRRSYLGYIWSILNPLMVMAVLVVVFSGLFRFEIPNFAVYLLCGQLVFNFMSEAATQASTAIIHNAPLLKKIYIPKEVFVVSRVTSALVNLFFSMIALVIVMFFTQASISWSVFWLPIIILEVYIFSLGVGLFLSAMNVFFRDTEYLWTVVSMTWMYLTPVIYPVSIIPKQYLWWYDKNPMYSYIGQFRSSVLYGQSLGISEVAYGFSAAIIAFMIGAWAFNRKKNDFILYI